MSSIRLTQQENTPKDAAAGQMMVYAKTDGQLYTKIGANAETLVHAGSGWLVNADSDVYVLSPQVGIGTSTPGGKVTVEGDSDNGDEDVQLRIVDNDTTVGSMKPHISM